MLPTFLVIGAQKSGTTSLVHYLAAHPQVYARTDELHFFDRYYERGLDWYSSQFEDAAAVGESSPEYMFRPEVAPRIAADLPGVKLVAILRDPVDRAYSQYWHNRTRGHEPLSFEDALAAEPDRASDLERYGYVGRGRYAEQLARFTGPVHLVIAERMWRDGAAAMAPLHSLLGLTEPAPAGALRQIRNPFIQFRSQRLRKPIRRLPGPLRRVAGKLNAKPASYPPMPAGVRARLAATFAESNAALGIDVPEWG